MTYTPVLGNPKDVALTPNYSLQHTSQEASYKQRRAGGQSRAQVKGQKVKGKNLEPLSFWEFLKGCGIDTAIY
jgi:hypothetical protein